MGYTSLFNFRGVVVLLKAIIKVRRHIRDNMTMCDVFKQTLQKHREKVAFVFEDKHWTFQEVEYFSNKVANYFQSIGYKKGDVVALFMENRPELVFFWLGLAKIGVISSLINFNLRKESLSHCISIVSAKGLVFSSDSTISGKVWSVQLQLGCTMAQPESIFFWGGDIEWLRNRTLRGV